MTTPPSRRFAAADPTPSDHAGAATADAATAGAPRPGAATVGADLLERELRIARRIQRSLVLLTGIEADGWEIASDYRPARSIGGDFFDVFPLLDPTRPRTLGVVIADVSGKGIAAALLMAFIRPVMRTALDRSGDPVEALNRTNRIMVEERPTGLFVTVLAGTLDLDTGELVFANAGHEPPLLVPGGATEPRWIEGHGTLIGAFRDPGLERTSVMIPPDGRLLLYTDGITDAMSPSGERYGEDRLRANAGGGQATAGETVQRVIDGVLRFQGEADPADDLALLVLRRLPAG